MKRRPRIPLHGESEGCDPQYPNQPSAVASEYS